MSINSIHMSDSDYRVPLHGHPDPTPLSKENMVKLVNRCDAAFHEVCNQLDALCKDTEEFMRDMTKGYALAGPAGAHVNESNYDGVAAMQQGARDDLNYVQNPQASFPTLEKFMPPVVGFPQLSHIDQGFCYPPQTSAVPRAPSQGHTLPQHEYNPAYLKNGPPSVYLRQPPAAQQGPAFSHEYNPDCSQPSSVVAAAAAGYAWPQHEYHSNGPPDVSHSQPSAVVPAPPQHLYPPTSSYPYYQQPQPHNIAGSFNAYHPTATIPQGQHAPLQTESNVASSMEPSSSALNKTASARPRKRKARQTFECEDGASSSIAPTSRKRKRRNITDDCKSGNFGPYMSADASATVMVMPVHDPMPVDISSRRTHDPDGNPLQTSRFGVMEVDNHCADGSDKVTKDLSPELTCVRSCDWTDQPCGLFVEVNKTRIEEHLWFWHGVKVKNSKSACQFGDCSDTQEIKNLGRHIEGVHFNMSYQCPYCNKPASRTDVVTRHQKECKVLFDKRAHAEREQYEFCPQPITKMVSGYIVPAKNAI
ncbi:uncharacterized protein EDB93DRAFT_1328312 [Suillus bovinus]|uniref:uncharacterized protein n=1 Tax=Suillus bovinus TaxID=48563 RepID=UPI001B87D434|nr:uncharacterized protein EDB93DRAFT_1328312 [Suillus bovinus]KAG2148174.1 hypothetical protein EDB93DRAFT_1328312 [Suillus bovinus]